MLVYFTWPTKTPGGGGVASPKICKKLGGAKCMILGE